MKMDRFGITYENIHAATEGYRKRGQRLADYRLYYPSKWEWALC